jgi:uncharacterized protein (TIGR02266 family)
VEPKRTILVADDAAMFRELGSVFLARTGRVVTANNGYESLALIDRERPNVVVADLNMPCMGGDELCRRIKADPALNEIPVILVTGTDLADDRARAVRAGADDVIAKPISRIALIQAVNRFLRRQPARGLVRVPLETDVRIVQGRDEDWATARNLSRGGIFVDAREPIAPATEVALSFRLPGAGAPLGPTAQVIWQRPGASDHPAGIGLQFLALDRDSADCIDAFVYENAPARGDSTPLAAAAGGTR